jgi:hypothetical protein
MPENNITPELLAAKLATVDEKFNTIHELLVRIEAQTVKTNGRVTAHDQKIQALEVARAAHFSECPQGPVISKLKDELNNKFVDLQKDLEEYRMIKKYPKIGLGVIVFSCVVLFVAAYVSWGQFTKSVERDIKQTQIEQSK